MSDSGVLRVRLSHGIGLKSADSNGFSDPYVKLTLGKEKRSSKIIYKTLNPRWDEDFQFRGHFQQTMRETLQVACWDHDRLSFNDHLGDGVLPLNQLTSQGLEHGARVECSVQLKDKQATPGEIFFVLSWEFDVPRAGGMPSAPRSAGCRTVGYPTGGGSFNGGATPGVPPRIASTFQYFDANRSGFLDYAELRNALSHYGIQRNVLEAAEIVRNYDDQPDGKLELAEFAELVRDLESGVMRSAGGAGIAGVPARVAKAFDECDANRSGFLDFGELRTALRRYGIDTSDAGAARVIRMYDSSPDGKLDLHEFARLVRDIENGTGPVVGAGPRSAGSASHVGAFTPGRPGSIAPGPSPMPPRSQLSSVAPYRPRSPPGYAGGGVGGVRRPYTGVAAGGYGVAAGLGTSYDTGLHRDGLCPGGLCGGGGCGSGLGGLAYLLDVVFRTILYSLCTALLVAPDKLLGNADSLARMFGQDSAQALVDDTPGFVWAFLLGTLACLLLVLIDCCGVRTACAQCCGERGGPGPCTRCWRSLRSCLLGNRWRPRYYDAGPSVGGYDRYNDGDDFAYENDYRRAARPEKGYNYV